VRIRVLQQIDLGLYRVTIEADRSVRLVPEAGDDGSIVIRRATSGQAVEAVLGTSVDDDDLR
jgi:hypothetical protein